MKRTGIMFHPGNGARRRGKGARSKTFRGSREWTPPLRCRGIPGLIPLACRTRRTIVITTKPQLTRPLPVWQATHPLLRRNIQVRLVLTHPLLRRNIQVRLVLIARVNRTTPRLTCNRSKQLPPEAPGQGTHFVARRLLHRSLSDPLSPGHGETNDSTGHEEIGYFSPFNIQQPPANTPRHPPP